MTRAEYHVDESIDLQEYLETRVKENVTTNLSVPAWPFQWPLPEGTMEMDTKVLEAWLDKLYGGVDVCRARDTQEYRAEVMWALTEQTATRLRLELESLKNADSSVIERLEGFAQVKDYLDMLRKDLEQQKKELEFPAAMQKAVDQAYEQWEQVAAAVKNKDHLVYGEWLSFKKKKLHIDEIQEALEKGQKELEQEKSAFAKQQTEQTATLKQEEARIRYAVKKWDEKVAEIRSQVTQEILEKVGDPEQHKRFLMQLATALLDHEFEKYKKTLENQTRAVVWNEFTSLLAAAQDPNEMTFVAYHEAMIATALSVIGDTAEYSQPRKTSDGYDNRNHPYWKGYALGKYLRSDTSM
jgi:small-conductance mechanosensitive channel